MQVGVGVAALVEQRLPLPHHAERLVVDDRDLDRDALDRAGGELLVGHLEAAVAVDRPHGRVGPADLGAHRGRHREAHRAEATGVDPGVRVLVADEVGGPHLVLADAGDVDRLGAGDRAEPLDDVLRGEARRRGRRSRAGTASSRRRGTSPSPRSRRCCPASCSACSATIRSAITSRQSPTIGTSATRFLPISAGSMSAWITLAPGANESRLPVTRSSKRAPRLMIRSLFCRARDRGHGAVHAGHAEVLRVAVGEGAARHQRGDDRDAGELGEHAQLLAGAGRGSRRRRRRAPGGATRAISRVASRICLACGRVTGR